MNKLEKKYGLPMGIAMVVGIVIGSGVFIKAGDVLKLTNGNLAYSILAWLVGGLIMVVNVFCFAIFAGRVSKFNGIVDYVEVSTNKRVAYHISWLITTLYYPTVCTTTSIFGSAYFVTLTGLDKVMFGKESTLIFDLIGKWQVLLLAFIFLSLFYVFNFVAPKISAKFQISATAIKLIPILVIAIVGLFASLINGSGGIIDAFSNPGTIEGMSNNFGSAIKKTSFAYDGWVCATVINAELKDSKKNLPRALTIGTVSVVVFYIIYYIGVSSFLGNSETMRLGANAPITIFFNLFGKFGEKLFLVLILISCFGGMNGVITGSVRGLYAMSCRGQGPFVKQANKLHEKFNMSLTSTIFGFCCSAFILLIWALSLNKVSFFKYFSTMDEVICALMYCIYIIVFIYIIRKFKDLNPFKRFVMPILAIIGSVFIIFCGTGFYQLIVDKTVEPLISFGVWIILFVIIMAPGFLFYRNDEEIYKLKREINLDIDLDQNN